MKSIHFVIIAVVRTSHHNWVSRCSGEKWNEWVCSAAIALYCLEQVESEKWMSDFESTFRKDIYRSFVFEFEQTKRKKKCNLHIFSFFLYSMCMIGSCLHRYKLQTAYCIHSWNVWQTIRRPRMSIDVIVVNKMKLALQLFNNLKRILLKLLKESEPKRTKRRLKARAKWKWDNYRECSYVCELNFTKRKRWRWREDDNQHRITMKNVNWRTVEIFCSTF